MVDTDTHSSAHIREAVSLCVRYWPNAHLGDVSPREDIRSAFWRLRQDLKAGKDLHSALCRLEADAYRHMDM